MPDLAAIVGSYSCPYCGELERLLFVQWGAIPNRYTIGDEVRWHSRGGQIAPPYTRHHTEREWNVGDPAVRDVLVRDVHQYPEGNANCSACGAPLGGAVIEVKDGRFASGRLLRTDALPPGEYLIPKPDGTYERRRDWEDRGYKYVSS